MTKHIRGEARDVGNKNCANHKALFDTMQVWWWSNKTIVLRAKAVFS